MTVWPAEVAAVLAAECSVVPYNVKGDRHEDQDESEGRWISLDRLTPAEVHVVHEHAQWRTREATVWPAEVAAALAAECSVIPQNVKGERHEDQNESEGRWKSLARLNARGRPRSA